MPSMATGVSRSTTEMRRGSAYLVRGRGRGRGRGRARVPRGDS